jgi:hypothetical protein
MSTQGSLPEIRTQTHRNLIGRIMTALPPVLSPSNILLPPTLYFPFIPTRETPIDLATTLLFPKIFYFVPEIA